ncbi:hypothetical protein AGMMS49991_06480 [Spirochaetia bacterium]|nr:hypothetical protein AGMMS49991_06480 [Spirochaetia bacterium]
MKYLWLCAIALLAVSCGGVVPDDPSKFSWTENNGKDKTEPDSWTSADSKFDGSAINDITYTGQKFIAVGDNGKLSWAWAASPGAWTPFPYRLATVDRQIYPYWYADTLIDGTSTVPNNNSTQFLATEAIKAVTFGGNDYLVWVGEGPTNDTGMGCRVMFDLYDLNPANKNVMTPIAVTRLNGNNTYPSTAVGNSRFGRGTINDITNSGIYFVIVGDDGKMSVSKDTAQNWYPISNVANQFCSSGAALSNTAADYTEPGYDIYAVTFGGSKFVAAGENGTISWAIPDATWKQSGTPAATSWISNPPSPVWTKADTGAAFGTDTIYALAYSPEGKTFVAAGAGGKIGWSDDGAVTWTAAGSPFGASAVHALAYGGGKFLAGGEDGKLAWSRDGKTWTMVSAAPFGANTVKAASYGLGRFVAADSSGALAYSNQQEIVDRPYYSITAAAGGEKE